MNDIVLIETLRSIGTTIDRGFDFLTFSIAFLVIVIAWRRQS